MPVYRYFFLSQIVSCAFVAAFVTICPCCSACLPLNKACFYLLVSCCLRLPHRVCLFVCLSVWLSVCLFVSTSVSACFSADCFWHVYVLSYAPLFLVFYGRTPM